MSDLSFVDVASAHWASRFIYFLADKGILNGYPEDKCFKPENPITIGEFCKVAIHAANITSVINDNTNHDHWARKYTDYVEKGKKSFSTPEQI